MLLKRKNGTFIRCFENNVLKKIRFWNIYKRFKDRYVFYHISAYTCSGELSFRPLMFVTVIFLSF